MVGCLGSTTALEGLLTGRFEGTADEGPQVGVKLGAGFGIDPNFGAPAWRVVFGIELFDNDSDRDVGGLSDRKDTRRNVRGTKTEDASD